MALACECNERLHRGKRRIIIEGVIHELASMRPRFFTAENLRQPGEGA